MPHEPAEVLPVEAGDEGERQEDRRDHGQPPHDLVLLGRDLALAEADQRQVRLEHADQLVALRDDLLLNPLHVVGDVAEVAE